MAARRLASIALAVIAGFGATVGQPPARAEQDQTPPQTPPAAQNPSPQTPQATFRTRIDSVSVDVSVTDKQGKPVTDLKIEDFEIRENKAPQQIEQFKLIAIPDAFDPAPAPDVLSMEAMNREVKRDDTRLIVFFLDDYHVRRINSMRLREQLARFASELTAHDLMALMYPLTPPQGLTFTYDRDGMANEIAHFEGRKYDYTPRNAYDAQLQMLPPEQQEQARNQIVISALVHLCDYLGKLRDGRKTVIYVSEGMSSMIPVGASVSGANSRVMPPAQSSPFASQELISDFTRVFAEASRANVSITTLDPRGLGNEFGAADNVNPEMERQINNEMTDVLRTVASQTDGRAIVNRNDPIPDLKQMLRETSSYYMLGYTTKAPHDGKFHEIQVKVNRKDIEVHARKGFWALTEDDIAKATAPTKPAAPRDVSAALDSLNSMSEPSSRRSVRVALGAGKGTGDKGLVTVTWETAPTTGPVDPLDVVDHVSITATSIYGDELFKGVIAKDAQASTAGRSAGTVSFEAPVGGVRVRSIAENANGLRLETDDQSVDVPDFGGKQPVITSPIVYRGRTVRDIQAIRASATPLPTPSRDFLRIERLLLRFSATAPGGATPVMSMRLLNQQGNSMADLPEPKALGDGRYESELGLGSLPAGNYIIEITATAGADKVRSLLAIHVSG